MSLQPVIDWLYATPISATIRDVSWIIPAIQSVHILAITVIVGSAIVTDMRLAGKMARDESMQAVARRYLPWMGWAILALVLSGTIMTIGEPERVLGNQIFWIKMSLLFVVTALTLLFRLALVDGRFSLDHPAIQRSVKPLAWVSLVLWVGIICCGRWIAYAM